MLEFLLRAKGRIPHHLAQMMTDGGHAVMIEGFLQPPRRSHEPEVLMQQHVIVAAGRPSEKTQLMGDTYRRPVSISRKNSYAEEFISTYFMIGLVRNRPAISSRNLSGTRSSASTMRIHSALA